MLLQVRLHLEFRLWKKAPIKKAIVLGDIFPLLVALASVAVDRMI